LHPLIPTSGDKRECCFKLNYFEIIIMESLIKFVQDEFVTKKEFPAFSAGDTITVFYEIREGEKTRTQFFKGVVIQVKGTGITKTFTIRKMSGTVGVERIFPINLPTLQKIEVNKKGSVRRKRIYYFRGLTGKKARIKENKY
jgi:large subunit ribosomal protein L19